MYSVNVMIMLGIALLFIVLGVFLIPSLGKKRPKRRRPIQELPGANKDWKGVSLRLEKHIYALRKEIAHLERRGQRLEGELTIQKDKYAKLQEKMNQERGWQKKEGLDLERKIREVISLKKELAHVEKELAKEHGDRLKLERAKDEKEEQISDEIEIKRALESEVHSLKVQVETFRKEALHLREINQKLSAKQQDTAWVAKTEYQRLEKVLQEREAELARLKSPEKL